MENIGPVILFLLYMALSAWAKQKKNKRFKERADHYTEQDESPPAPGSKVESIFEQLKQELFEEEEEILPPFFNESEAAEEIQMEPEPTPQVETLGEVPFVEGSSSLDDDNELEETLYQQIKVQHLPEDEESTRRLEDVLEPYSVIEQGIILREILGKPRAMQRNDEWFHSH
ncbi:MAG: hypothetical protein K9M49_08715 [Candidatus Marinimicrobia bacterium]|nr:hypothetical protein [Candidatus Neomarinimicrobiota bacterium]MCF7851283.1 hypothetical protein [Candidatus Neomarinimicrobiota bacterium]MCF7905218.1 hypothetical protein [Candidatus Neomarinimicrobiota bacterium]